jgi:hypothetical protein
VEDLRAIPDKRFLSTSLFSTALTHVSQFARDSVPRGARSLFDVRAWAVPWRREAIPVGAKESPPAVHHSRRRNGGGFDADLKFHLNRTYLHRFIGTDYERPEAATIQFFDDATAIAA